MNIMRDIAHRPWPLPSKNWIMRQSWRNFLFTHWPIPTEILRPHIPSSLEIDTYNGSAWLGVVVFVMEGIYPRGLSSVSLTPTFPEINVRTMSIMMGNPVFFSCLLMWVTGPPIQSQRNGIVCLTKKHYFFSKRRTNLSLPKCS